MSDRPIPSIIGAPWRCRHGWHAWRLVSAEKSREIGIGMPWGGFVCKRKDRCQRCGLTINRDHGPVPNKRVRIWQAPPTSSENT